MSGMVLKYDCRDLFLSKLKFSDVQRAKIIAVAFRGTGGSIIAHAVNRVVRGHPRMFTIHAEEFLIQKLRKIKAKERHGYISVCVMRWSKVNKWCCARPCQSCYDALMKYGIRDIVYTNSCGEFVTDVRFAC